MAQEKPTVLYVDDLPINLKLFEATFRNDLLKLEYKTSGGSNKPIKYLLMTVEYYYQWFKDGATGSPTCLDKSRVYDFAGTFDNTLMRLLKLAENLDNEGKGEASEEIHKVIRKHFITL